MLSAAVETGIRLAAACAIAASNDAASPLVVRGTCADQFAVEGLTA